MTDLAAKEMAKWVSSMQVRRLIDSRGAMQCCIRMYWVPFLGGEEVIKACARFICSFI